MGLSQMTLNQLISLNASGHKENMINWTYFLYFRPWAFYSRNYGTTIITNNNSCTPIQKTFKMK